MNRKDISVLYIESKEINLLDIPSALDEIGYNVYKATLNLSVERFNTEECENLINILNEYDVQYAISYDFSESIAQACFVCNIPYISWVYDAPQKELYTHYAQYPSNYIFVFDKMQKERMKEIGLKNVYYMPLAILPNKVQYVLEQKINEEKPAEIAFVGQLYKRDSLNELINKAEENVRQSMKKTLEEDCLRWDKNSGVHGKMEDICVKHFSREDGEKIPKLYPYMTEQFYYEAAITCRLLANKERVAILNALAEKYDVRFYTKDEDTSQLSEKVKVLPPVGYDAISHIYHNSKININVTLHCIESGINQRVFDVMATGGFMLSNYQKELEEIFVVGEEIVLYHNLEELLELAEYYLTHEEERKRIAKKGQEKVWKYHDLHDRMDKVMEFVIKKEMTREKPYLVMQKEWLCEKADELLRIKKEKSYAQLHELLNERKYQTCILHTNELLKLKELVMCWNIENETRESNILADVSSVKEAEYKYLRIYHGLLRIESGIRENKCREAVYQMCENKDSKLLIGNIIKKMFKCREDVFVMTSRYMQEYNIADAIELLSYGVCFYYENKELVLQLANYYMELGMWDNVLKILQKIPQPDEEIRDLIKEIQNALGVNEDE